MIKFFMNELTTKRSWYSGWRVVDRVHLQLEDYCGYVSGLINMYFYKTAFCITYNIVILL